MNKIRVRLIVFQKANKRPMYVQDIDFTDRRRTGPSTPMFQAQLLDAADSLLHQVLGVHVKVYGAGEKREKYKDPHATCPYCGGPKEKKKKGKKHG